MLGRIVYRQRMAVGISQEDLADQVGLDRTYISGIERGIRNPTFLVLLRLAQVLGVPPALFMEEGQSQNVKITVDDPPLSATLESQPRPDSTRHETHRP